MTYFLSAFFFPIAALIVLFGLGLLVAAGGGNRMRPELIAPAGLGAVIVFGQFTAWSGISTPVNVIAMVVLAAVGYVLLARKRSAFWPEGVEPRSWGWWLIPGVLAGGIVLATIIFFGRASMAGFLLDTTSTVQMLGGDFALHGSDNFNSVRQVDGGSAMIAGYFGQSAYPYGSQIALALLGSLSGTGLLWVYTPFMALMVTLAGFGLFRIARLLGLSNAWSAVAAFVAAVPALVYAIALQGAIKELVFIPVLIVLSLLLLDPVLRSTKRSIAITGAICGTAAIGAIGLAALAWIIPLGLAAILAQTRWFKGEWTPKDAFTAVGFTLLAFVIAMIPKLGGVAGAIDLATHLSETNTKLAADPGNLTQPIRKVQGFGVWFGGSHRVDPNLPHETWAVIAIVAAAFVVGAIALLARRRWTAVIWVGTSIFLWYLLTWRGTLWLDSKLVLIASHVLLIVAVFGAAQIRLVADGLSWPSGDNWKRRWQMAPAYGVVALIVLGVVASNGMQYLATGLLPTDRYKELETINTKYAGQGPAYMPDFDENAFYTIRDVGGLGPGNVFANAAYTTYRNGTPVGYGHSADIDTLADRSYKDFKLVIQRRSPQRSRPGADYDLTSSSQYYDVFRRNNTKVVRHVPAGKQTALGTPKCKLVRELAGEAKKDSSLKLVAATSPIHSDFIDVKEMKFNGPLAQLARFHDVSGAGTIAFTADVSEGQNLWWQGTVSRPVDVQIDGKSIGSLPYSLGGDGNVSGPLKVPAGKHAFLITRPGGSPKPGGRLGSVLNGLYFAPTQPAEVKEVDPADAESELCGQQVDWIELVSKN